MIYYATPYSSDKSLVESYNAIYDRLYPNDWGCILDGDAMFTTRTFGHQIESVIKANESTYKVFTCMTNRVANNQQLVSGTWNNNDMNYHREIGDKVWDDWFNIVDDITNSSLFSGVMVLMQAKTWNEIYPDIVKSGYTMLGVDNEIHKQARAKGYKVGLMRGIYVMHYYRNGNKSDKGHLT